MIKVVVRAQLNLHSKYSLEKMKLKTILESLHREINQSGFTLEFKGGFDPLSSILGVEQQQQDQEQNPSEQHLKMAAQSQFADV